MSATPELRFLQALRRLKGRTDYLEEMAKWKDDIASRLWRAEATLRVTGEPLHDFEQLQQEVNAYKICCDILKAKNEEAA